MFNQKLLLLITTYTCFAYFNRKYRKSENVQIKWENISQKLRSTKKSTVQNKI